MVEVQMVEFFQGKETLGVVFEPESIHLVPDELAEYLVMHGKAVMVGPLPKPPEEKQKAKAKKG